MMTTAMAKKVTPRFIEIFNLPKVKEFSTTTAKNAQQDNENENGDFMEREKELFKIKREMSSHFSKGNYQDALIKATELEIKAGKLLGKRNVVYASCLNNLALMHKNLGQHDEAVKNYTTALHLYEDMVGKETQSYAATLTNLGSLYRNMAVTSKGMEKHELLTRAEEALSDGLSIRNKILGETHKESLLTSVHLSSVYSLRGDTQQAEALLRSSLATAQSVHQPTDLLNATIMNNLGVLLKGQGAARYGESKEMYQMALDIRSAVLGDTHNDVIITQHNLAELYIAMGDTAAATAIQEKIVALFDNKHNELPGNTAVVTRRSSSTDNRGLGSHAESSSMAETSESENPVLDRVKDTTLVNSPSPSSVTSSNTRFDPT